MKPMRSFLLLVLGGAFTCAQSTFQLTQDGQPITVADRMAQEQTQGMAMIILLDRTPVLHEQSGYRNTAAALPVTPTTVFQVGSMRKPTKHLAVRLKTDLNKSGDNSYAPILILQQIMMDHYNLPFPELMSRYLFEPLGQSTNADRNE